MAASAEEQLRRLIERMSAKLEKRVDEMYSATKHLQNEVDSVRQDSTRISSLQEEQMSLVRSFADTRLREVSCVLGGSVKLVCMSEFPLQSFAQKVARGHCVTSGPISE